MSSNVSAAAGSVDFRAYGSVIYEGIGMPVMYRSEILERIDEVMGLSVWRGGANVHEVAIENPEYFPRLVDGFRDADPVRIAAALSRAMDEWAADAQSDGTGRPGVVYAWFDGQAGQLRMSFVSGDKGAIPFRIRLRFVSRIEEIVAEYVAGEDPVGAAELNVFAREVPGTA
ncbi:hypothetical protein [Kitasatospora sp. A2-31]|uniref:hypothetical protein n=1 Tax=Kitasatospora sp. A2-31 TaxID=2916414 RepID=UPI001EEB0F08|nr:hypothetical protein [Kitasatospora sp. A2-31]MCG6495787.1 hypothetical protein [Kitasatospora sp. A2-31]